MILTGNNGSEYQGVQVYARIRPRLDQWAKYTELAGISTDVVLARQMGMSPPSVSRVLRKGGDVGAKFIAAALTAFPALVFDDLFLLVVNQAPHVQRPEPLAGASRDSAPRPQGPQPR